MPKVCELCGCNAKAGHEQACKVINEIHIKVHDVFANYLEKQLRKKYNAMKVTAGNDNRALNNKKPDVEITVDGKKVYLDIGITFDTKRYFRIKQNHYAQMKDQNGDPLRVIPIIIGIRTVQFTQNRENFQMSLILGWKAFSRRQETYLEYIKPTAQQSCIRKR
ncbi:Hypothetical_protein [Hexamita inflata]|uniref:Hypothetical_protein n=1 Tax=Hexamita inflata TaxID=28002 RepID=A0AA86VTM3_9EUKA|nr:Hypothetical protein HINF_LOCUS65178 [Hexamita inflata]